MKPVKGVASNPEKILIVYLSRTGNTRVVADIIHQHVGGTMVALELVNPYPADFRAVVGQVVRENESGFLPPLKTRIADLDRYETVFLGFPTWGMRLPPPMKSFLSGHDLSGKTVIPFNTNAGYGIGSTFATVEELCRGCTIVQGFSTSGGVSRRGDSFELVGARREQVKVEVEQWLKSIGMIP